MRLLDLFCGAGGAAMGYHRAGFDEIVGVDIKPQKNYPFEFVQADWESALATIPKLWEREGAEYVIHASPPCQRHSAITRVHGMNVVESHPELIKDTRARLEAIGAPFVIENVVGAPLLDPLMLCGSMFGLGVRRHRLFEGSVPDWPPMACNHATPAVPVYGHTGAGANRNRERERGRSNGIAEWREAMGIDWMTVAEITEAIPPAYTEYIGRELLRQLAVKP